MRIIRFNGKNIPWSVYKLKRIRAKSMDFATIPDKIETNIFKDKLKNAKIPENRFFDRKTRTIINLQSKNE